MRYLSFLSEHGFLGMEFRQEIDKDVEEILKISKRYQKTRYGYSITLYLSKRPHFSSNYYSTYFNGSLDRVTFIMDLKK